MKGKNYEKETSINNKIVIVTGGDNGVGRQTAIDLARRGARVYITSADEQAGIASVKAIKNHSCQMHVFFIQLDLSSFDSIRKFSRQFHEKEEYLHILVNNEKKVFVRQSETEDGFETHFGVNYLGHFLLTNLLMDLLKKSAPSRVVIASSFLHRFGNFDQNKLISNSPYCRFRAYANSELANNLFIHEFSKRMNPYGITANSLDPGIVVPKLSEKRHWRIILEYPLKVVLKSSSEGAQTAVCLAVDPDLEKVSGKFFSNCEIARKSEKSCDDELAEWLWLRSEDFVCLTNI